MDIKDKLKQFRLDNDLTLEDTAHYTEVSRATLGRIEQGLANPGQATIDKIEKGIILYCLGSDYSESALEELEMMKFFLRTTGAPLEMRLKKGRVEFWNTITGAGVRMGFDSLIGITSKAMNAYGDEFRNRFPHLWRANLHASPPARGMYTGRNSDG